MKYLKSLDSVRAFAVSLVLIWHFLPRHDIRTPLGVFEQFIIPTGSFAVTLFFVLSGFLITSILLHDREMNSSRRQVIWNFIIRRSLRIFPLYYFLLIFMILIGFPFITYEIPYQLSFTSNIFLYKLNDWTFYSHTWSLSVEEQFYLLWPFLILFVPEKGYPWMFFLLMIVAIISSMYYVGERGFFEDEPWYVLLQTNLGAFAVGGLYSWLNKSEKGRKQARILIPYFFWSALLLALFWKVSPYIAAKPVLGYLKIIVDSLLAIGVIHYVMGLRSGLMFDLFADNKWLHSLGKISYGVYLYHLPIKYLFNQHLMNRADLAGIPDNPYLWFIIYFAVVVAISYWSYELFERRFLKLKRHFSFTES
jgi:peptidoglycan/LPS O-acetylase OafA/YrhL